MASASQLASEQRIAQKIELLFRDRGVFSLAKATLAPDEYAHWRATAAEIQKRIYAIDTFYEVSADVSETSQIPLWAAVASALQVSGAPAEYAVWKSFADLHEYAAVESRIHAEDPIHPSEFGQIAALKCSDVTIARSLIWTYEQRPGRATREFWSCIDQCGELVEDLADVAEDGHDWNFNFWLYSFMASRGASLSVEGAAAALSSRLSSLEAAYARLSCSEQQELQTVLTSTFSSGRRTLRKFHSVHQLIASGSVEQYKNLPRETRVLAATA